MKKLRPGRKDMVMLLILDLKRRIKRVTHGSDMRERRRKPARTKCRNDWHDSEILMLTCR